MKGVSDPSKKIAQPRRSFIHLDALLFIYLFIYWSLIFVTATWAFIA